MLFRSWMYNPWAGSGSRTCYIRPLEQVKKLKNYKKLLLNDGDFMNVFKFHWTVKNFATYYNSSDGNDIKPEAIKGLVK